MDTKWFDERPIGRRLRPLANEFVSAVRLAKAAGLRGYDARLAADRVVGEMTGVSVLSFLQIECPPEYDPDYTSDHFRNFLTLCQDILVSDDDQALAGKAEVYAVYQRWATKYGGVVLTMPAFRATAIAYGAVEVRRSDGRYWRGLVLDKGGE